MDTKNLILGLVMILIVVIPVAFLATSGRRKLKKSVKRFKEYATSHSLNLHECDCCYHLLIGIDSNAKKLIYKQGNSEAQILDLKKVKNCECRINSEINDGNYVDKLEMELELNDPQKTKLQLEFFNSDNVMYMNDEKEIMESWKQKIVSCIA